MVLIEAISIVRGVLLFITQIIAGIIAAALTRVLSHGKLDVRTTLTGGTTVAQGVIIEMILTAQLVFTIFMLAAEKYEGNFVAPVGIGLSLFVAELVGQHSPFPSLPSPNYLRKKYSRTEKSFCIDACRRLLDGRLPEPSPVLRSRRGHPLLPLHAVDLLGGPPGGFLVGRDHLQDHQGARGRGNR